jgi:hypothetical protein
LSNNVEIGEDVAQVLVAYFRRLRLGKVAKFEIEEIQPSTPNIQKQAANTKRVTKNLILQQVNLKKTAIGSNLQRDVCKIMEKNKAFRIKQMK